MKTKNNEPVQAVNKEIVSFELTSNPAPSPIVDDTKRGWIMDELIKIGHLEAGMSHGDEQITYLKDQLSKQEDAETARKMVDDLALNEEMLQIDYANRVNSLNDIFDSIPGSDRHYYCRVKHAATAFIIACENFHARKCSEQAEMSMYEASRTLAMACSLAFGFEPLECLRCLDEAIKKTATYPL